MSIDDGGSAFPEIHTDVEWPDRDSDQPPVAFVSSRGGMSMREYYAGQALIAYAALPHYRLQGQDHIARRCFEMADAMIKAGKVKVGEE